MEYANSVGFLDDFPTHDLWSKQVCEYIENDDIYIYIFIYTYVRAFWSMSKNMLFVFFQFQSLVCGHGGSACGSTFACSN